MTHCVSETCFAGAMPKAGHDKVMALVQWAQAMAIGRVSTIRVPLHAERDDRLSKCLR